MSFVQHLFVYFASSVIFLTLAPPPPFTHIREGIVYPRVAEISLFGGLGCGKVRTLCSVYVGFRRIYTHSLSLSFSAIIASPGRAS